MIVRDTNAEQVPAWITTSPLANRLKITIVTVMKDTKRKSDQTVFTFAGTFLIAHPTHACPVPVLTWLGTTSATVLQVLRRRQQKNSNMTAFLWFVACHPRLIMVNSQRILSTRISPPR